MSSSLNMQIDVNSSSSIGSVGEIKHDKECEVDFGGKFLSLDTMVDDNYPFVRLCKRCGCLIDTKFPGGKNLGRPDKMPGPDDYYMRLGSDIGVAKFGYIRYPKGRVVTLPDEYPEIRIPDDSRGDATEDETPNDLSEYRLPPTVPGQGRPKRRVKQTTFFNPCE